MKKYVNWSIFAGVGILLAAGITIFHYFILPIAINYQVTRTLALENGTDSWDRFITTPIPINMALRFFTLVNPEEVIAGAKPNVTEVGPYVYKESWEKRDVRVDSEKDSIFYRQGIRFDFDPDLSGGGRSEDDVITIVNPLVHILLDVIDSIPTINIVDEMLEFALAELLGENYGPLLKVRVRDILFDGLIIPCGNASLSYTSRFFCSALQHWAPIRILESDQNGNVVARLLKFKEVSPIYEMVRGNDDPSKRGMIVSVDGKTNLHAWWCDEGNTVAGYDMVMFPSFVTKYTSIPFFSYEAKRSVKIVYSEETSFEEIDGLRFKASDEFMGDLKDYPDNKCYCPGSAKNITTPKPCLEGSGVLDVTSAFDLPVFLSFPHFYKASENWQTQVDGLNPTPEKHETYMDIEPTTGIPMRGYRRIQISFLGKHSTALKMLRNHREALIPLVWVEEGTELGPNEISLIKDQLLYILKIVTIVRWTLFSAGLLMFCIGTGMAIYMRRKEMSLKEEDDVSID